MESFKSYLFREACREIQKLGDKLAPVDNLIDWEAFRPIVQGPYDNRSPRGGRPNIAEVVIVKMLVLQQWYGLTDPELERQVEFFSRSLTKSYFPPYNAFVIPK